MKQSMPIRIFNKAPAVPTVDDQHWYKITAAVKAEGDDEGEPAPIEVYVYGEIGGWGISANQFIQDLKAVDDGVSPVVVAFNTNGGDLFEGLAIHNALNRLGERCTGRVDALAASAGSVAVCGAHRVVMASNAILMIHNPYTWAGGDAEELRRVADVLDTAFEVIIAAYKAKAPGIDETELRRMVNDETWLTAQEALKLGLADEVGNGLQVRACLGQATTMARYKNTPQALLDQLEPGSDPAADDPAVPFEPPASNPADATALALMITQACAKAGISNLVEPLIASTKLTSQTEVQSALKRASDVHSLCVAARLPELTADFVKAGLEPDAVRARLFEKLVGTGKGIEIDNSLPPADDDPEKVKAQLPNPSNIWAARRQAANKGARP